MAEIITERIEQELTCEGVTMVIESVAYPIVSGLPKKAARRINAFYAHHAKALMKRIKKHILPAAAEEYANSLERSVLFRPFEVSLTFTVSYNGGDILSLYRDFHMRGGGERYSERFGDTWSAVTGWLLELRSFFPSGTNYRRQLINNATEIAAKQEKAGTHRFYGNFPKLIKRNFSPDNFFITDSGVTIFYAEQSVAPSSEGIPVFALDTGLSEAEVTISSVHPA